MAKKTTRTLSTEGQIVQLDPTRILAEDNIRYGLLPHRVDRMAENIVERGGIMVPVEVQELTPAEATNGFTHRLTAGFIRHAATLKLNKEQNAGLMLPAVVYSPADATDRLMRQIAENNERENLSPMDRATAIKKMLDAGSPLDDVQKAFAVPGGRKGLAMQPASPATIKMHLSFLELPKSVQTKIHDGRVGVAAAYELTKVPKEEQAAILETAESNRLRAIEKDEKAAEREAKAAGKVAGSEAKLTAVTEKLTAAEQASADAKTIHAAAVERAKVERAMGPDETRLGVPYADWDEAEKKAKAQRIGEAKAAVRAAEKTLSKTGKDLANAQIAHRKVADPKPAEAAPSAEKVQAKAKAGKATVGPQDVKKAAADAGVKGSKPVALSVKDATAAAALLAKSRLSKVAAIGKILGQVLCGELAPAKAETELSLITGERVTKKA